MQEIIEVRRTLMQANASSQKPSLKERIIESMTTLNTLVSWTLEESLENAVSMRARGYGTSSRTSATFYTFDTRDFWLIGISILLMIFILVGTFMGLNQPTSTHCFVAFYWGCILLFASLPLWIEGREALRWHFMKSTT
ncbi:MAG: hypothetical protein RR582_04095 [Niameybacter sp.]